MREKNLNTERSLSTAQVKKTNVSRHSKHYFSIRFTISFMKLLLQSAHRVLPDRNNIKH